MKQTFKKLTAVFAAAALTVTCLPQEAIAESITQDADTLTYQDFEYEYYYEGVTITGYNGNDAEVVIPSEIEENTVIGIWDSAFQQNTSITKVTIPNTVEWIGDFAFQGCSLLKTVDIEQESLSDETVLEIYDDTFADCTSLTSVNLPDRLSWLGERAFMNCTSLVSINIPYQIEEIREQTFSGCKSLETINIAVDENDKTCQLDEIKDKAFENCESLSSLVLPEGVRILEHYVFAGCSGLTSIVIPGTVKNLFYDDFFADCVSLKSVVLSEGFEGIDDTIFKGLSALETVELPESLTNIDANAFQDCTSLKSIKIPGSIGKINYGVFSGCTSLEDVEIGYGITEINDEAFYNCSSLTSISIPEGVTKIGEYSGAWSGKTFDGCTSLEKVELPESLTMIAYKSFNDCTSLTDITLPESVKSISHFAFSGCTSLEHINLPEQLDYIDSYTFRNCSSLVSIEIPENVETIYYGAFLGCTSLAYVEIPANVKNIYQSFTGCTSLTAVILDDGLTLGYDYGKNDPFENCSSDLVIYGYSDSNAPKYAESWNIDFIPIDKVLKDEGSDALAVFKEKSASDADKLVVKQLGQNAEQNSLTYDISVYNAANEKVEPKGDVVVFIPVPENFENKPLYVYYANPNGTLADMHATVAGNYIIFTTNHFSEYIVTTEKLTTLEPGDVNNDGEVGELDSVELARYLANWNVTIDKDAADLDGDGEVGETDSVILARRLAGWNV